MNHTDIAATLHEYEPLLVLITVLAAYTLGRIQEWLRQDKRRQAEDHLREQQHRRHFQKHGVNCHAILPVLAITACQGVAGFFVFLLLSIFLLLGFALWPMRDRFDDWDEGEEEDSNKED